MDTNGVKSQKYMYICMYCEVVEATNSLCYELMYLM